MNRRNFLSTTAASTIAGIAISTPESLGAASMGDEKTAQTATVGKHTLPPLPYEYNALEPFIDEQTMRLHHDKHHLAYVNGLNKAENELLKARTSGDFSLVQYWSKAATFHGGGHFLHTMFWETMAPKGKAGEPSSELGNAIISSFGSQADFKKYFIEVAKSVEGSGWALLHVRAADKQLLIFPAENQNKLSPWGTVPILGCDVWEHAYYLKYQNRRDEYAAAWWNVINWNEVSRRYAAAVR